MTTLPPIDPQNICLVTVTYGNRFSLLKRVIEAAFANGVGRAVVVDNGCVNAINTELKTLSLEIQEKTHVCQLGKNMGSAGGFHAGLKAAVEEVENQYIWLLDDDNLPAADALQQLLAEYEKLRTNNKSGKLAVLSQRSDRLYLNQVAQTGSVDQSYPPRSSFLGFHFKDLETKLVKHFWKPKTGSRPNKTPSMSNIEVPYGPYGGLFFHTDVLLDMGYPLPEMYLYGDDTEFTCRLTAGGGRIFLIPESRVEDIDQSWMQTTKGGNSFARYLNATSDQRVYYSIRNQIIVERRFWTTNKPAYLFNQFFSLAVLTMLTALSPKKKFTRYKLILQAVNDGRQGKMESPFA